MQKTPDNHYFSYSTAVLFTCNFAISRSKNNLSTVVDRLCVLLLVTKHFNESNRFAGDKEKMAYVVREPIIRGMYNVMYASIADYSIQFIAITRVM